MDTERLADICAARGLTERQTRFVVHWLTHRNATRAYKAAYEVKVSTSPRWVISAAYKVMHNPKVKPIIAELRDQVVPEIIERTIAVSAIDRTFVLTELYKIAAANMADYGDILEDGTFLIDLNRCSRDQLAAITELTSTTHPDGSVSTKIKLHGKRLALIDMGKELGMFVDRKSIDVNILSPEQQRAREELRQRMFAALARMERGEIMDDEPTLIAPPQPNGKANGSNGSGHDD